MRINLTGRRMVIPPGLRKYAADRIEKLERIVGGIVEAHVVLAASRHGYRAEIVLHARSLTLSGNAEAADGRKAVRAAMERIERQARRSKEKRTGRRKRPGRALLARPARPAPRAERDTPPIVIASDGFRRKPLSVDEAAWEVQDS
ncbi:MAG: ribosome-associated translation inhibitor RaiA, partial [Acidobacteria bacterium]|nr:ribosome-associated translation inhibitor RaiA [Acidobacteriota bacterium]